MRKVIGIIVIILAAVIGVAAITSVQATGGWELVSTEYGDCVANDANDCQNAGGTKEVTKTYEKYGWVCPQGYHPFVGDLCEKDGHQFDLKSKVKAVVDTKTEVSYEDCEVTPPPCEEPKDYCDTLEGIQTEEEECPREEQEPPCTQNCGTPPTFAGSTTEAPVCQDGNTVNLPANPHVIRNGSQAIVNFFITEGDSANVYWKTNEATAWQHAASGLKGNSDNFATYTIEGLDPNKGYDFGIQQKKGCGGGQLVTAVIIDPPAQGEVFRFSYWQW